MQLISYAAHNTGMAIADLSSYEALAANHQEKHMQHKLIHSLIGAFALTALAGYQALAETIVEISPEQRVQIKEYVVKQKLKPITVERVTVGSTIPADVELITAPSDWGPSVSTYRYVYSSDRVVLVEPSSRKVVQIIE
jgi:hypothetical protein